MIWIPPKKSRGILKIMSLGEKPQFPQTTLDLPSEMLDINNKNTSKMSGYPGGNWAVNRNQLAQKKDFKETPIEDPSRLSRSDTAENTVD